MVPKVGDRPVCHWACAQGRVGWHGLLLAIRIRKHQGKHSVLRTSGQPRRADTISRVLGCRRCSPNTELA